MANDSIVSRHSLFIIPHMAYQQETSWSVGVAGGYYFKSDDISRISSISGSADYTLLNQFIFNITPKIYFADKKWYFYSNLNFRNYPDYYYGIGNSVTGLKQPFIAQNINVSLQPQHAVTKEFLIGFLLSYRYENTITDDAFDSNSDYIYSAYGREGWDAYHQTNAGVIVSYDSRDNQFYPATGIFAKITTSASLQFLESTYKTNEISIDFRKYFHIFNKNILAVQGYMSGVFSKSSIPFQLLPTVGGRDYLRGFRQGMYRDNLLFLLQSEYRFPVYKRLKAAVFCSAGDVVNSDNFIVDKLKVSYGAGVRYRLNDARVHLRFDIAKNNYGEKLQFYITATEAF
jgi:outer membrane protein assembly factor BamA